MEVLTAFLLAFFFSFIGSIPPATINLTVVQLGLEHKINIALKLSLAAALVEYPYAWIAAEFENLITSSPMVVENFKLITALVMLTFGVINLSSANKPSKFTERISNSGFRRGLILGILNPLAIPYWIAMIALMKGQKWLDLSTTLRLQAFLLGVTLGAFTLLILVAFLAKKVARHFQQSVWLKRIPGLVMLGLGIYALITYLISLNSVQL
jgi:threonine/homoserine/homoserine lactone efflux protein